MNTVQDHYARHLGPVYSWMAGGVTVALARGAAELDALDLRDGAGALAVDLGAGFGMHTIPLAQRGYAVLAYDSDPALLRELSAAAAPLRLPLPVQTREGDLLEFRQHVKGPARVVLCMGDTLTHLPHRAAVQTLFAAVAATLDTAGLLVLTFRNYAEPLVAEQRFIPVKSDANRILTCFLEYAEDHITVHDLLHEREDAGWNMRVSSYRKLRLDPDWVCAELEAHGLAVTRAAGLSGMVRLVAKR